MKTIIFDFDGTIADSFNAALEVAYDLIKHPSLINRDEIARLRKHPLSDMHKELGILKFKWPYLLVRGRSLFTEKINDVQLFEGMGEAIETLNKSGYKLLIMSSNSAKNISKFLKNNNIDQNFLRIYGGVGLFGKAVALKRIMANNHLKTSDVIYVGDEIRDVEAAKKSKINCIAVSWGYNDPELLGLSRPFILAETPKDIIKAIKMWDS